MTILFRERREADDLAALLDGTPVSTPLGGTPRLVAVADTLRRLGDPGLTPRADFVAELRERLVREATEVLTSTAATTRTLTLPPRTRRPRERRMAVAASVLVVLGGTAGMAAAAQDAIPGQALYPVKRGIENLRADLAGSDGARAQDLLGQADNRLREAGRLVGSGPAATPRLPGTLRDFDRQARAATDLMMASYRATGDARTVRSVRAFTATSMASVARLSRTAPVAAQPGLRTTATALQEIDAQAGSACTACSDLPELTVPRVLLASAEADRALADVSRMAGTSSLDNSHPALNPGELTGSADGPTASSSAGVTTSPSPSASPDGSSSGAPRPSGSPGVDPSGAAQLPGKVASKLPGKGGGRSLPSSPLGDLLGSVLPSDPAGGLVP